MEWKKDADVFDNTIAQLKSNQATCCLLMVTSHKRNESDGINHFVVRMIISM